MVPFYHLYGSDDYTIAFHELTPSSVLKLYLCLRYDWVAEWGGTFYQVTVIIYSPFYKRFPLIDAAFNFFQQVIIVAEETCIPLSPRVGVR